MPSSRTLVLLLAMLASACQMASPSGDASTLAASAAGVPQRIVSLDYCADQFVLKLADRNQIAAVSPDAGKDFSYMRASAAGVPQVRSQAEDVLALRPDLVVRSYGGGPGVGALLERAGVPVAQIGYAGDFDGVRTTITEMGAALGQPTRARALIDDMDRRLAAARTSGPARPSALYMTPSGVTTGEGSLVHELMLAAGLVNFEVAPGWKPIPLERLVHDRPDLIAAASFGTPASNPDTWSSARHPVAARQLEDRPVVALEGAWTACGGWFLVEAVEALAAGRTRLEAEAGR